LRHLKRESIRFAFPVTGDGRRRLLACRKGWAPLLGEDIPLSFERRACSNRRLSGDRRQSVLVLVAEG